LRIDRRQRPAHVVSDREHVARESRDAVIASVRDLPLGSPTHVLHLGERAQQLVLVVGRFTRQLLDQRGHPLGFARRGVRARQGLRSHRRDVVGTARSRIRHLVVPATKWVLSAGISGLCREKSSSYRALRAN
jgi:hypothetical protein